eukprot:gnl/MRDRNA2_/MRDRNA2_88174_c0_seq1.p1 gnl/MRDRNA2_/MRDRNA2_88174_c0~~gnl/MRDRNA2_/MRDRNA2_88174_c0_seq1.p1  ORF type:complete len:442 (-),score=136.45 gnl/MRDRNA2_/MRDRNA2_88174_c0_seq1:247-1572(-)
MDVESGKKFLQQQTADKPSVFEHFASIIDKVILQKPDDPYGALEVLSRLIKAPEPTGESFDEAELEEKKASVTKMMEITEVPQEGEGGPKTVCAIPDFMEEASMLEWAGVGFGELESYQIMCSLRKLAADAGEDGILKLRFWGKIFCTNADYYVAEGQMEAAGEPDENDPDFEPQGTGANAFTFWVTTSLTGTWEKLPHAAPKHIIAARKIKKILTGDLNAKVITHPHFPGTEKELLRAQIARITADTVLCINGFVVANEDGEIAENPEFECPPTDELGKPTGWTHERDHILKTGRTTHHEIPEEAEEEEEIKKKLKMQKEQEADPVRSRVRSIATDPDLMWAVRQGGDKSRYKSGETTKSYAVTTVRCLTWPGAVTACKGTQFTNLYVGHGLKYGEPDFFPCAPLDIQEEPEDPGEMPEPQPEGAPPTQEEPKGEEEGGG